MKLELARQYAAELVDYLKPYCDRIEVAGGIRREKSEPHDIEVVVKPKFKDATEGWFQPVYYNALDAKMQGLVHDGGWDLTHTLEHGDPDKAGKKAPCGPKYYRLKYRREKLDLFAVIPPAQWGVIFAIRTGDADYSHWLVQQGWPQGIKVEDGRLVMRGAFPSGIEYLDTPEERDVFEMLEVPWIEPRLRTIAATQLPRR
jgi:DNA polymerase/3'-5' exonuclease PolX